MTSSTGFRWYAAAHRSHPSMNLEAGQRPSDKTPRLPWQLRDDRHRVGVYVQTASLAPDPVRRAALHAAYDLVEAVQLPDIVAARVEIEGRLAEAERSGLPETTANPLFALAVDAFYNSPDDAPAVIGTLIDRAEALGELGNCSAAGLCLRPEPALRAGDVVGILRMPAGPSWSWTTSVIRQPGSGLIGAATAYESLSLWELGVEMHDGAAELLPDLRGTGVLPPVISFNLWKHLVSVDRRPARSGRVREGRRSAAGPHRGPARDPPAGLLAPNNVNY